MGHLAVSKSFEHNGFKFDEVVDGFYIFRRTDPLTGQKQTCKANIDDLNSGNIYKMIDAGFSRI